MRYAAIAFLMVLSAFFSASETAFSSVNKIRLRHDADKGSKKAARALKIAESYDRTLTTILIGNNIVNILSASLGTIVFTELFGAAGVGIATAVMTVLVLIFGEIIPKNLAKENSERFAPASAGLLDVMIKLLYPLSSLFMLLKNKVSGMFKAGGKPSVTEDELKYLIDEIEEEGVLEEQESDLVQNALEFDEKTVEQILVPRVRICAVEKNADISEIRDKFISEGYSRMPVYENDIDNIIGMITEKDLFSLLSRPDPPADVSEIIQKAMHFTEFMRISEALREMQRAKQHIAVVNDQYGGTRGIVTMEDIIEELVGEIYDESDEVDQSFTELGENVYEVAASMAVADMTERMDLPDDLIKSESNTAGGWAMELFGRIPKTGETVTDGIFTVSIAAADESHVERLTVKVDRPGDDTDDTKNEERTSDSDGNIS